MVGLWKLLRFVCLATLVVGLVAVCCLILPFTFNVCHDGGAGQIVCDSPIYRTAFDTGFAIVMFGAYTGLPALLAGAGALFLVSRIFTLRRGSG